MAKSSIHIEAGKEGYLAHNDRSKPTVNSIFSDEENEVSNSSKKAFEIYRRALATRSEAYTKRTKQKLQKKTTTHLSAIVNLNKHHTLEDLKKVANHLEETFDTKVFQMAIHRDEGHIDKNGKALKNYHAHIEFLGLDSEGRSVRRKLTKKSLINLQNTVANLLQMDRGINYARERKPRPKRLGTYEYKEHKKKESEALLQEQAKVKDLNKSIKDLREKLQQQEAIREQYAYLEEFNQKLKAKVKAKKLTIKQMNKEIKFFIQRVVDLEFHAFDTIDEYADITERFAREYAISAEAEKQKREGFMTYYKGEVSYYTLYEDEIENSYSLERRINDLTTRTEEQAKEIDKLLPLKKYQAIYLELEKRIAKGQALLLEIPPTLEPLSEEERAELKKGLNKIYKDIKQANNTLAPIPSPDNSIEPKEVEPKPQKTQKKTIVRDITPWR